jgi:hypothetical protein
MSRLKTYPVTHYEFDDLVKALDTDRQGLAKICDGITKDAIGWWRFKERIPVVHVESLAHALEKKLKGKMELNPVQERALAFVKTALAGGSAIPLSSKSPFYSSFTDKKSGKSQPKESGIEFDLSNARLEDLIEELQRRGGVVTFGSKKPKK